MAHALAITGETLRARDFLAAAWAAARAVAPASPSAEPKLPVSIACALVILGDIDDALRLARSSAGPSGLAAVAAELARVGLADQAEALADEISAPAPGPAAREAARGPFAYLARGMDRSDVLPRLATLATLARIAADRADTDRAIRLCERIESATTSSAARFLDETAPTALAEALATAGYVDQALALAGGVSDPGEAQVALIGVVRFARYAEREKLLTAVRSWTQQDQVAAGLAIVAETAARAGDTALATTLTEEAVALAMRLDSSDELARFPVLTIAARAMALIDEPERACSIAGLITETESFRYVALLGAVAEAAEAGRLDSAHHIARVIDDPGQRAGALARVAQAAVRAGQPDRARALAIASSAEPLGQARSATAAAATVSHSGQDFAVAAFTIQSMSEDPRPEVSALIAEVFAAIGDQAQARATADATLATARSIYPPRYKSNALSHAALAMAACGDIDQALSITEEAMTAAKDIRTWRKQNAAERTTMRARGSIARTVANNGDLATATAITASIAEDDIRAEFLIDMALDLASSGDEANAIEIAHAIGDPLEQATALAAIAEAMTGPRAQILIGQALQVGNWEPCLTTLAKITPAAVAAIADEVNLLLAATG